MTFSLKSRWKQLGVFDKLFVILAISYVILSLLAPGRGFTILLQLVVFVLGAWEVLALTRIALRRVIWRLRNRLIVAYLLIAVVPILLILALVGLGGYIMASQMAIYMVRSELERRVSALGPVLDNLARVPAVNRQPALRQTAEVYQQRYPGIVFISADRGTALHSPDGSTIDLEKIPASGSGIVNIEGRYFIWSSLEQNGARFVAAMPLTRRYLSDLVPKLGDVSLRRVDLGNGKLRLAPLPNEPATVALPPPANRWDLDVAWPSLLQAIDLDRPENTALILVHTRFSALGQILLSERVDELQGGVLIAFYAVSAAFLVVGIIGLVIGVSLTRTITAAVHSLYEGTQRVMRGDFSHLIKVSGNDQLAELSSSFNSMTENLERLLAVAKEKERLQAEIEIAREVQEQLYPKTAPVLETLRITGMCQPARMVSGDYYDYQLLEGGRLAIAIGDVAGKGISAALLMATIQAALRTELRGSLERLAEMAAPSHARVNGVRLSTAQMVSDLNQQLYATTSPEKYATFCLALYDEQTGTVTYTNAGHLPPILIRNGSPINLDINGTVVGAFPFAKYDESKVQLERGDLLVWYTDGITEPENEYGEMFGEERLIGLVSKNADREDSKIIDAVMEAVRQWTHSPELTDDMTVVLARRQ